ncbi:MAG: DUF2784 domain-containing protein [Nitrospirota bacterium]
MSGSARLFGLLADATATVHAAFVLFVVGGQLLILAGWLRNWRWTRRFWFRAAHLGAIGFVVLEAWFGVPCPLTLVENDLRARAGQTIYDTSFIGYWMERLLYYEAPAWVFTLTYTIFIAIVIATFLLYPPVRRPRPG